MLTNVGPGTPSSQLRRPRLSTLVLITSGHRTFCALDPRYDVIALLNTGLILRESELLIGEIENGARAFISMANWYCLGIWPNFGVFLPHRGNVEAWFRVSTLYKYVGSG